MTIIDENNDIDFVYNEEVNAKELLKLIALSINQEKSTSLFEKVQLLIHTLNELVSDRLLIMTNLNIFLSNEEYQFVIEQINLNNQTALFIESNQYNLEHISHNYLDADFVFFSDVVK